jgi:hypothetical protein
VFSTSQSPRLLISYQTVFKSSGTPFGSTERNFSHLVNPTQPHLPAIESAQSIDPS